MDLNTYKQKRLQNQVHAIEFIKNTGIITQTCNEIAAKQPLVGYNIYDLFPFLEVLQPTTKPVLLEWVNLNEFLFTGFFDFELSILPDEPNKILCTIIDHTHLLHKITEIQQDRNNTLLHFEHLVDSQVFLEKDRHELRNRNLFLEEQSSFRNSFYAKVTHELRTPINGIVGLANLLTNKETAINEKYINTIKASASHLAVLVKEFLDISKIDAGKVEFEAIPFKLSEVLTSVTTAFEYLAIEKNLDIFYEIQAGTANFVLGDPTRLSQILYNLVGNATKFTRDGFIKVRISNQKSETNGKFWLHFLVEDSGIGIKPDALERIFNSFEQADDSTYRNHGGTGLGLHICKQLIELQGGTISLKSTLGKGSKFYFTLPFFAANPSNLPSITKRKNTQKLDHALNILVAEDDSINQLILRNILNSFDVNFKIVSNGVDVLQELANFHFHLILLDIEMPRLNGIETLELIRTTFEEPHRSVAIIALTGNEPKEPNYYESLGFDGYLIKPFAKKDLFDLIKKTLKIN